MKIKLRKLDKTSNYSFISSIFLSFKDLAKIYSNLYTMESAKEAYEFHLDEYKKKISTYNLLELLIHQEILLIKDLERKNEL